MCFFVHFHGVIVMRYFLVFLIALGVPLIAQAQCTDNTGCAWSTTTSTYRVNLGDPECNATVTYKTRTCGGVFEYYITGIVIHFGCAGFDPALSYFHRDRNALMEYINQGLLSQGLATSIPPCSTGTAARANVFTASCGIWVCCTYAISGDDALDCDPGWEGAHPHTNGTPKTVKSCKWQSCGTQCCKRSYTMCTRANTDTGGDYYDIVYTGKTAIGDCTGTGAYYPRPCETDCQ